MEADEVITVRDHERMRATRRHPGETCRKASLAVAREELDCVAGRARAGASLPSAVAAGAGFFDPSTAAGFFDPFTAGRAADVGYLGFAAGGGAAGPGAAQAAPLAGLRGGAAGEPSRKRPLRAAAAASEWASALPAAQRRRFADAADSPGFSSVEGAADLGKRRGAAAPPPSTPAPQRGGARWHRARRPRARPRATSAPSRSCLQSWT
jgi:hypothetical protein